MQRSSKPYRNSHLPQPLQVSLSPTLPLPSTDPPPPPTCLITMVLLPCTARLALLSVTLPFPSKRAPGCWPMDGGGGFMGPPPVPRSPEVVFRDYRARQAGLIRAITTDKPTSSLTSPHPPPLVLLQSLAPPSPSRSQRPRRPRSASRSATSPTSPRQGVGPPSPAAAMGRSRHRCREPRYVRLSN
jgi:hypothetical protein